MVLVDTSVWVDYLRGVDTREADWLDRHLAVERLGLVDLVLCEVLQGVSNDADAARVLRALENFAVLETGGQALAVESARSYRRLRSAGRTVRKTIDCLIATFCLREGHVLLHCDRDFIPFEEVLGLRVVRP